MAEALVALDRVADAISHLSPDTLTTADIITVPPEVKADPGMLSCFCMLNCAIHRSYETAKEKKYKKRRNKQKYLTSAESEVVKSGVFSLLNV